MEQKMQRAQIDEFPGGIRIFTPYSKNFVEDLKAEIPYQYRGWEPEDKCWRVDDPYVDDAIEIVNRYFEPDTGAPRTSGRGTTASSGGHDLAACLAAVKTAHPDYAELFLLPGAPTSLVESAYRTLSKLYHPDLGGDLTRMQRLNVAHDRLSESW